MVDAFVNGIRTLYSIDGPPDGRAIMLSHSLASDCSIWEPQVATFRARYRVLTYDIRGHGGTEAPSGPCSLDDLVEDAVALLDRLGIDKAHFVGLSLGGMVGQLFALRYPDRLLSLVLCDTASEMRSTAWAERIATALREGMESGYSPDANHGNQL